ncbi:MAG: hypothetical protein Metus_0506 [Candidatus Methanosuratincola subterraneus]|uniref:Uncharacterized protein n=1 Tax=Methanosuratincola subterraneus TaxID=2593994 RepID=A0A444L812_METS7|nr:MAG: hypothetical protein Metus_0506 [Candidatus Methanosuratincola subterraneus]
MCDRLPKFYKGWDRGSLVYAFISSFASQIDDADDQIAEIMRSHWVDSARGQDLDLLGAAVASKRMQGEGDEKYRSRIRRAVSDYRGGGTVRAILESVMGLIGTSTEGDVEIVENPLLSLSEEVKVMAGETWTISSRTVEDVDPRISISIEEGGEVKDPTLTNLKTGEVVTFKGTLVGGQELVLSKGRSELNGEDVTGRVEIKGFPRLLREGSVWKYSESLSGLLGVFDSAKFDEHTFTKGIPYLTIRFEWEGHAPASFEVRIRSGALKRSGLGVEDVERFVSKMRAAGVSSRVRVI